MNRLVCLLALACVSFAGAQATPVPGTASRLPTLVATERAFAAATVEMGVRNGFLTFFADDAVTTEPSPGDAIVEVTSARPRLLAQPLPAGPPAVRLEWRPFTGQIASDGSIGWLTGPYVNRDVASGTPRSQGAYFSVWRRQADGTWRVWLDLGVSLPEVWDSGAAFEPAEAPGAGTIAPESIDAVEQSLATRLGEWSARLSAHVRLHFDGRMPIVGAAAARAWRDESPAVRDVIARTVLSDSGDLAVTLGGYETTPASSRDRGVLVRVWQRNTAGQWQLVFETRKAFP